MSSTGRTPKIFGSSYQPPRPRHSKEKLGYSWRAILIVVAVGGVFLLIARLPVFRLKNIELLGDKNDQIASDLSDLQGQPIFSRGVNDFIHSAKANLLVSDFTCRRGLPNALRCNLSLRQPTIIWQSGDQQYLVDQAGVVFALKSADLPDIVVVNDQQHQPVKLGLQVASSEIIAQYQLLVKKLKEQQLSPTSLQLNESLYQVTAILERPGKSPIQALFLLSGDISSQAVEVGSALSQKGDAISQYIDVRVPGYIYTK